MKVGYARTSTVEQEAGFKAQIKELKAAGCKRIFQEQTSAVGQTSSPHQNRRCPCRSSPRKPAAKRQKCLNLRRVQARFRSRPLPFDLPWHTAPPLTPLRPEEIVRVADALADRKIENFKNWDLSEPRHNVGSGRGSISGGTPLTNAAERRGSWPPGTATGVRSPPVMRWGGLVSCASPALLTP